MHHPDLEARVDALETKLGRSRLLPFVLLAVAAADTPGDVRARRLEVVDSEGRLAAVIQSHGMGGGLLSLYDRAGTPRLQLGAADGGDLVIKDGHGNDLLRATTTPEGRGAFVVYNGDGRAVVQLTSDADDSGFVATFNERGYGKSLQPRPTDALGIRAERPIDELVDEAAEPDRVGP